MSSQQLIGSRISLISKKDIRYEGILYGIDVENSSVTLQDVKSWGTENRVEGPQVPASDEIFGCIVFRGQDIKDLHVHDTPAEAPKPAQPMVAPPPGALGPPPVPAQEQQQRADTGKLEGGGKPAKYQPPHKKPNFKPKGEGGKRGGDSAPPGPSGPHAIPGKTVGTGDHLMARPNRGGGGIAVESEEFDFQAALSQFDKDAERTEIYGVGTAADAAGGLDGGEALALAAAPAPAPKKYNKSSFFDEISCDALDGRHRVPGFTERKLNTETFGATGVNTGNRQDRVLNLVIKEQHLLARYQGRGRGGYRGGYRSYNQRSGSGTQGTST
ncbi:Scd6-like Sm domain-containing protein [Tribonema minus]|uniref:Scd6-like Sm domain-containing protein n=1 Tax=Tribonema minus TaxID=303371 RepID=A0A836C876_9STRA|nr:Scd6-like Sm domain-containing protein [Tribonema minus]